MFKLKDLTNEGDRHANFNNWEELVRFAWIPVVTFLENPIGKLGWRLCPTMVIKRSFHSSNL